MSDNLQDSDIHNQEISAIMDSIRKDPRAQSLIGAEEEIKLVKRMKTHPNDRDARDRFVLANAGLVTLVARKFSNFCVNATMGDLIQEGNIGLMKAIPRYNPIHEGKRTRFTTYAVSWIAQRIRICVQDNRNVFPLKHGAELCQKLRRAKREFFLANLQDATVADLAKMLGWKESKVRRVQGYLQTPASLEDPLRSAEGEARTLGDTFVDDSSSHPSDSLEEGEHSDILYAALNRLDDRPVLIVALRHGLMGAPKKTLREVGKRLSLSSERVRQCEEAAFESIQKAIALRQDFLRVQPIEVNQGKARCATLLAMAETGSALSNSLGVAPWKIEDEETD